MVFLLYSYITRNETNKNKKQNRSIKHIKNNKNMEDKDMRHIIVRSILGIVWIIVGIAGLAMGRLENGIFCSVMGALFLFTAFRMWKKNRQNEK